MTTTLDAALTLAEQGFAVFPLRPHSKAPATTRGLHDASRDPEVIRGWFEKRPDFGLAVATGAVSGVVVVDVDVKGDAPGMDSMHELALPSTLTSRTKSGGWHLWFAHPGGTVRNAVGTLPGIDIRGDGGYVVVPPTSGYEWETSVAQPRIPWSRVAEKFPAKSHAEPLQDRIPASQRNSTLASLAGSMRRRGASVEEIEAALTVANARRCDPPLPDEEVGRIAASVGRYEPEPDQTLRIQRPGEPAQAPTQSYAPTDLGNAERLRDYFNGDVLASSAEGFYLYEDGVWRPDALERVHTAAQQVARTIEDDKWRTRSQSSSSIAAMQRELSALPGVAVDINRMDAHHHLLAFRNGVVNLRTGELQPHDRDLMLTRRVELDYNPDARCPRWLQFLGQIFPNNADLPAYIQRLVGYGITGETVEQAFAIFYGTGANGKTVLVDTLTEIFRALTVTTPFSTFEERKSDRPTNDLATLKGARLVMAAEGNPGRAMDEALIKRVTGRDMIAARRLYKEFFEFRPTFLIMLATNHKPSFKGQDEGLWRRVKLIPFSRYFAPQERDHYLGDKLMTEAEGIAAWAVKGAIEWYARGLQDPPSVVEATKSYRDTSDALSGFFPGMFVPDPTGAVPAVDVHKAYLSWAEHEGLSARETWGRRWLYAALEERGLTRDGYRGSMLRGLRRAEANGHASQDVVVEGSRSSARSVSLDEF